MSYLNNKSEFNLDGAELLIDNNIYAPSIHCSYYSVFQKLKYKYILKSDISYEELASKIMSDTRNTHKFIIEEFCNFIQDSYEKRNLKNKINDLKAFRIESDYEDLEINYDKSNLALTKSKELLREINKI